MEQMEQYIPPETTRREDKVLEISLTMQVALAKKHGEDFYDFTELHGDDFRKTLDTHPELLSKFETRPEEALEEIEKIIYH